MMIHRAYRIRGRVQGVGFRWWTRSQAQRLELTGSVRNREDGTVEVTLHGSPAQIAEMERLLHQGPSGAEVSAVEQMPNPAPPADGFRITG